MRNRTRSMWSKVTRALGLSEENSGVHLHGGAGFLGSDASNALHEVTHGTSSMGARTLSRHAGDASAPATIHARQIATRRGTFLILVVGTLALLSVIAIVYVTIGTSDTRVQVAGVRRESTEDVPQKVGDYIANVIARDRMAVQYDDADFDVLSTNSFYPVMMRETTDYPSTDWLVRSDVPEPRYNDSRWAFDPAGTIATEKFFAAQAGFRRPSVAGSDPWLASTEPTWVGIDPTDSAQLANPTDVTRLYRDNNDWAQISNFAPNGRFVNLWNLRNSFNAAPGVAANQMSNGLTLFNGQNYVTTTIWGTSGDLNVPAMWTMNQRFAARPAAFVPYTQNDLGERIDNINFKLYQWADADGDGILDARWCELVDDRGGITNILGDTGKYRYFIAARAVDLSAAVNVNTASDFRATVKNDASAGVTPADVDLRRLFSMIDVYDANAPLAGDEILGGYDGIRNPLPSLDPNQQIAGNYAPSAGGGNPATFPPADIGLGYSKSRAEQVANYGYIALRLSIAAGVPLGTTSFDDAFTFRGDDLSLANAAFGITPQQWDFAAESSRRRGYYQQRIAGSFELINPSPTGWKSEMRFSNADLSELLTRYTINDPDITSALETVLGGRDNTAAGPFSGSLRYSPLRDNRPLELELASIPNATYDQPFAPYDSNGAAQVQSPLEVFSTRYQTHMSADVRHRITTLSGSVPFRPIRGVSAAALSTNELPLDVGAVIDPQYGLFTGNFTTSPTIDVNSAEVRSIFSAYCDQLLPFSGVNLPASAGGDGAWDEGSEAGGELQTLAYGWRGPEVALYAAAHMAVNFADMADSEIETKGDNNPTDPNTRANDYELNIPSVYTLVVNPLLVVRPPLDTDGTDEFIGSAFAVNPFDNHDLDLSDFSFGRLSPGGSTSPIKADAVNIFGIEAQPFITRVSTFTTYGDNDHDSTDTDPIVIDVSMRQANTEFKYRVVAWQLTNPFTVPIVLWDSAVEAPSLPAAPGTLEAPKSRYYIEMDGRQYLIRPLRETGAVYNEGEVLSPPETESNRTIVIYPRRSIVVYTTSQTPADIAARFTNSPTTAAQIRAAIESTLGDSNPASNENEPDDVLDPLAAAYVSMYTPDPNVIQEIYYIGSVNNSVPRPRETETLPAAQTFNRLITTDNPESRLWRRVRTETTPLFGGGTGGGLTIPIEFDMLVDRLRVPRAEPGAVVDPDTVPILNRRLGNPANDQVASAMGAEDNIPVEGTIDDSEWRFPTITLWSSVRRPSNPGEPPLGALPAYCLEPKGATRWNVFNNDRLNIGSGTWTIPNEMPRDTVTWKLEASVFNTSSSVRDANYSGAFSDINNWRTNMTTRVLTAFGDGAAVAPNADNALPLLDTPAYVWGKPTSAQPVVYAVVGADPWRSNPLIPQTQFYNKWYPEVAINNSYFRAPNTPLLATDPIVRTRTLRVADMLLPLAVGPVMNPAFNETTTELERRWTTFGESMAISLGYQPRDPANTAVAVSSLLPDDVARLIDPLAISPTYTDRASYINRPLFDRGQLRLDEFVLFRDRNTNGLFDYAPGSATSRDERKFTEVPAALGILDAFIVGAVGNTPLNSDVSAFFGGNISRPFSDLTKPIPGLININTASDTVLRSLPLLSPLDPQSQTKVQNLTFSPTAVGTYRLSYDGVQAISPARVTASASDLLAQLNLIPALNGNVAVQLVSANPPTFSVTFIGALANQDVPENITIVQQPSGGGSITIALDGIPVTVGGPSWWGAGSGLDRNVDLVATLVAARDKTRAFLRPQSSLTEATVSAAGLDPANVTPILDPNAPAGIAAEVITFNDRDPTQSDPIAARDLYWPQGLSRVQLEEWLRDREGRYSRSEIPGVSENLGFGTIGALQTAIIRDGDTTTNRTTLLNPAGARVDIGGLPIGMDFMGYRTVASTPPAFPNLDGRIQQDSSRPGFTSTLYPTRFVSSARLRAADEVAVDSIAGEYKEKITPLAALSNVITTRSDYFAVWFVIHGYEESDVSGLASNDPLVPSIARRFLMVIDRSNVVVAGQRPRVVLFREVPMTN